MSTIQSSATQPAAPTEVRLNHLRCGAGEPLVLIHGIGSQWQMWLPVLDRLAAERDVIAIDLPGFGASPVVEHEPEVGALADAVAALVAQLGLERPHVAGNSLGGGVALQLASTGRARGATLLSPIGFAEGWERPYGIFVLQSSRRIARRAGHRLDAPLRTRAGRAALQGHLFGRPWRIPAEEAIRATHNLVDSPGYDATFPHVVAFDWSQGDLDVPVTIAWGTRDRLLLPRQGKRARERMPRARHVRLRGCGHIPTWDDPEAVANVILEGSRERAAR
ncbi:MAG TPA: alpha/beta hydrolase [Solirubrobacteraceae bacterium]|nr:alpha/beta hydrolase [Solirubrobacteraceae bacterium]